MKKLLIAVVCLSGLFASAQMYEATVDTIAAGSTSVTITNTSTSGFVWYIDDVYGVCSTNATDADTVTMSYATADAPTVFYPVDTGSIVSNGVNLRIDVDGIVQVEPSGLIKFERTANTTNSTLSLLIINRQVK